MASQNSTKYATTLVSKPLQPRFIVVLQGGWSVSQRQCSLRSGHDVLESLRALGHYVVSVDPCQNISDFIIQLKNSFATESPEIIFNALAGNWGQDGTLQGILETVGIPYTSSGIMASAIASNRRISRRIAESFQFQILPGEFMSLDEYSTGSHKYQTQFPHVVKTVGKSIGSELIIVQSVNDMNTVTKNWYLDVNELFVENYVENARELIVIVANGSVLGIGERCQEVLLNDLELEKMTQQDDETVKGNDNTSTLTLNDGRRLIPAVLDSEVEDEIHRIATTMHTTFGCRGISRTKFIFAQNSSNDDGEVENESVLYYVKTNTQPRLEKNGEVYEIASYSGWTYPELIQWIVEDASLSR